LHQQFQQFGIPLVTSPGRRPAYDLDEIRQLVDDLRVTHGIKCGYKRAAESIAHPGRAPPYHAVRQIMHPEKPISHRPKDLHEHRFEAKYVDYLWHTDLHEILITNSETGVMHLVYLIAFLDDASRFIMHHRLIPEKTAETCAGVLLETLQSWGPPCVLGSDNGGEFVGKKCVGVLEENRISRWNTKPHTPQQNGKMERFWTTIEKCRNNECRETLIAEIISEYNQKWIHRILQMTPERARHVKINSQSPLAEIFPEIQRNVHWTA
jgi:transposase InsO family protein